MKNTLTSESTKKIIENTLLSVPAWVNKCHLNRNGEIVVDIFPEAVQPFFNYIKNHTNLQMKMLLDITAVDYPDRKNRFEIVYICLSLQFNVRLRVHVSVDETTSISSIESLYKSANWFERETWDLFGIYFSNHSDLRRILTDYGFQGHALRKDFPLSGYVEVRYDESEKRVLIEKLDMAQDYRFFEFSNPWETNK